MRKLKTTLLLILFTQVLSAQLYLSPGIFTGGRAWQTDSIDYNGGPDHGVNLWLYPVHDPDVEIHFLVQASCEYTSIYVPVVDEVNRFIHVRGGVGITNSQYVFATINVGYLSNISDNADSVPTLDGQLSFVFPVEPLFGGLQFFISGIAGFTFYNPYYLKTTDNIGLFSGQLGVRYRIN